MNFAILLLVAFLLVPIAYLSGQLLGRRTGWLVSAGMLALAAWVSWLWLADSDSQTHSVPWIPALDISVRLSLDGLGFLFALIVLLVGAAVMAYAVHYLPEGAHGVFYALLTFFSAAMLLLVSADDLILLWVAWEFTTICSFLLIQQSGPKGRDPAVRTLIVTLGGGLCLLAAVILTVIVTGTTRLGEALTSSAWADQPGLQGTVAVLVAVAAFTKSAQFPFHGWLPDAMVASTPVSAYLHAAAMVKAGIFLLLRFTTAFHDLVLWNTLLLTVGSTTAVLGAVFALQRFDLKELLAYSTISQLGFLVATIGLGSGYAVIAALAHVVAHAIFKSALFLSVGLIDHETETRDLRVLSGLRRSMPVTSALLLLAAASMAGLPPLLGFVSKEALFKALSAGLDSAYWPGPGATWLVMTVAVFAACCTFAYSARMLRPLIGAPMTPEPSDAPGAMMAPVVILVVAGVIFGFAGSALHPLVNGAAGVVLSEPATADLTLWHGLNPALAMSVTVVALGSLLVGARGAVDRLLIGRQFSPVRAVTVVTIMEQTTARVGGGIARLTRSDRPAAQLTAPLAVFGAIAAWGFAAAGLPRVVPGRALDWLVLALVTVGLVFTLRANTRVSLVTTVGIVGFLVGLLFFSLGATDVAITQVLVEILTVVVLVLVLVRLPGSFHPGSSQRRLHALLMAVAAGLAASYVALVVMSSGEVSPVGATFTREAYSLTGGSNVVNTILVDFRALDTLGEMVVLGVAALALMVALESRGLLPRSPSSIAVPADNPALDSVDNTLVLRVTERLVVPVLLVLAGWLFLRGHYWPGGGFIGALVAGAALALVFLAAADDWVVRLHIDYVRVISAGIIVAVAAGFAGLIGEGSFLRPIYGSLAGFGISTGLVFDVGVFLTVLGLILSALSRLGVEGHDEAPLRAPTELTVRPEDAPDGRGIGRGAGSDD